MHSYTYLSLFIFSLVLCEFIDNLFYIMHGIEWATLIKLDLVHGERVSKESSYRVAY